MPTTVTRIDVNTIPEPLTQWLVNGKYVSSPVDLSVVGIQTGPSMKVCSSPINTSVFGKSSTTWTISDNYIYNSSTNSFSQVFHHDLNGTPHSTPQARDESNNSIVQQRYNQGYADAQQYIQPSLEEREAWIKSVSDSENYANGIRTKTQEQLAEADNVINNYTFDEQKQWLSNHTPNTFYYNRVIYSQKVQNSYGTEFGTSSDMEQLQTWLTENPGHSHFREGVETVLNQKLQHFIDLSSIEELNDWIQRHFENPLNDKIMWSEKYQKHCGRQHGESQSLEELQKWLSDNPGISHFRSGIEEVYQRKLREAGKKYAESENVLTLQKWLAEHTGKSPFRDNVEQIFKQKLEQLNNFYEENKNVLESLDITINESNIDIQEESKQFSPITTHSRLLFSFDNQSIANSVYLNEQSHPSEESVKKNVANDFH